MKYFIIPLLLGLAMVAALNLYVDPSGRWRTNNYNFSTNWNKDKVWVIPERIEERSARAKQIEMLPKVDLLGLGSSRFYMIDSSMFPAGANFYNASVSGATAWDYIALWEKFKQQGKPPKHLIVFVDSWTFNKNTWQKYRWIPNYRLANDFLDENKDAMSDYYTQKAHAAVEYLSGSFYEFSDLFSPAVVKVSLEELQRRLKKGEVKSNYISLLSQRPPEFPALKNDGTHLFAKEDEIPKSLEKITEIGKNTGLGGMYVYMREWETYDTAIALMNDLLADAEKNHVDVLLVQPPFQHAAYDILVSNPEYKAIPGRYAAIMDSLLQLHKNARYCNVLDPRAAGCKETEFMDSSHMLPACARKVISHCLQKEQGK